ncbi:hypothetical protein Tco_0280339 [Tanacetum coccineum]
MIRGQPGLDELEFDDLYNNLKVYEHELKGVSNSNSQNIAFLSTEVKGSTLKQSTVEPAHIPKGYAQAASSTMQAAPNCASHSDEIICSFFAQQASYASTHDDGRFHDGMLKVNKMIGKLELMQNMCTFVHFRQDGLGDFDWSNKADDTPVSLALMATNSEVPYCSKCSKSYKKLLENYQTERDNFQKARSEILGYQMSLESLEVILKTHEKNEYAWGDKYEQMEYDLKLRDLKLEEKQKELDQVLKERDDFKVKLEKWTNAAVLQNEVLNKQRYLSDKSCIGFGVESSSSKESDNSSGNTNSTESLYPNFQKAKGFHAVPPPTGTIIPPRANVSFTGIDELAIRNKVVNQENTKFSQPEIDRVIIEDWVDSDDEETALNLLEIQKKTILNSENSETSFENRSPNSQNSVGQGSRKKGLGHKGGKTCFWPARSRVPQAVLSRSTDGSYYPRLDSRRPRISRYSPSSRSSTTRTPHRPQRPKKIVKTIWGNPEEDLKDYAIIDSGCSGSMTGDKDKLSDFKEFKGGYVAFGNDSKGGRISGKGTIKTSMLRFLENKECLILSPKFKFVDEDLVILRAPRKNDVYSLDLKNIIPSGGITCLGKQHRASCKKIEERTVREPLELLHMDLFGPVSVESINKKKYCFCVTDDAANSLEFKKSLMNEFFAKKESREEIALPLKGYLLGYSTNSKGFRVYNRVTRKVQDCLHVNFLENQDNQKGKGPDWMFDLDLLTPSMNYIPVRKENYADSKEQGITCDDAEELDDQQFIVHTTQPIPPEESTAAKEVKLSSEDQALHDELVSLMHQESLAKTHNDDQRIAFEEEKRRISIAKGKEHVDSTFNLSTANTPPQSTGNTPTDSDDDTPTGGVFSTNSFDAEEGGVADYNNLDPTIDVPSTPTLRILKDSSIKCQIFGKVLLDSNKKKASRQYFKSTIKALLSFIIQAK